MDQTIMFDKTYSERYDKFSDILTENVSATEVLAEWSSYLEATVDHLGWQAIWKIPHQVCEDFNITFPTLALVFVDNINFKDLTASVKIVNVQNGIELPKSECLSACLFHLWPTEEQDETVFLNINETSEALDTLRFFHKYLWRPWDEENTQNNWFQKNLVPRLKVYYDLKQGLISKNLRDYYRLQLIESKEKYEKFQKLQKEYQEYDLDYYFLDYFDKLCNLNVSITESRTILEQFENSFLREKVFNKSNKSGTKTSNFWIVISSDQKFDNYLEFIQNVKAFSNSGCEFNTAKSLQKALDSASAKDTIFIGSGKHVVQSSGNLTEGGKIINVNYPEKAVISTTNEHLIFNFINGEINLQNLTFQLDTIRYGIRVRNGAILKLENCTIQGYKNTVTDSTTDLLISTQQGIVSDKGANLQLQNCQFSCMGTALRLDGGAATLHCCVVSDVRCAVRAQNNASLTLANCKFRHCLECIIQVETVDEQDQQDQKICSGINLLNSIPNMKQIEIDIKNISVPEVIITKKLRFRPVRDIFSNPVFNTTLNRI